MADSKNALKSVVVWLNDIFEVIAAQLQDVEAKTEVLKALGLDTAGASHSPSIPTGSLDSIRSYIDKSDDEINIEAFLSIVIDIIKISNAIDDFIHLVTDSEDPDIVNDFFDMMLQLYLTEAVRLRTDTKDGKAFYLICKIINFYQELAEPSGGISNFTANIGAFLKKVFTSFNAENDEEAALASDTIFIIIAALSYKFDFIRDNLKVIYGYDPSPESTSPNADLISERTLTMSLSYKVKDLEDNEITATLIVSTAVRPQTQQGGGLEVLLSGNGKFERKFDNWKFTFAMDGIADVDMRTTIKLEYVGGLDDLEVSVPGKPAASAVVASIDAVLPFSLPADLSGSQAIAEENASGAVSFGLKKNGSNIGSINFAAGNTKATFTFGSEVKFSAGDKLEITAPSPQDSTLANVAITLAVDSDVETQSPLLIGDSKGTHLQIGGPSIQLKASIADNDLDIKLATKDSAFALVKGKTDSFLNSILPDKGVFGSFDFGLGYSLNKGVYVDGGSGLTVFIPLHTELGPLLLNSFYLKLGGNENKDGVLMETSIGMSTNFMGFSASVERIGLLHNFSIPASGEKNLGFINYDIDFKPPNGVGLSLDAGVLKGGGFLYFDPDKGEYFGALELSFKDLFTLKAIGIITTKMPDGSSGFSLLVIITAEFSPIQLGLGFTLNGVGGLLGLNRTAMIDLLRQGIKTNTLNSILFPTDVVANMSRIISDLKSVFPPLNDRFLIMPMAKLGWGTPSIIVLELGLLLEIPVPRIAILGVIKALLPDEDKALLRIQVNFLGVIDFDNKYISFDASLYDSRLLTFTLAGDMAFRLSWGNTNVFILSVGGFHPAFRDAPGDLQNMTRLTLSLLSGENPRITIQCYFAVTSNTVQFGAKAELYAAAAGFNVYGFIGFDLLFQFDPFKFIADFAAGLALRRGSSVIMGIRVSGELSGPTPWDARGEASFSILFFDVTVSFHETWGDPPDAIGSATEDLTKRLTQEIDDDRNWKADTPNANNLHVSLKKMDTPTDKVVVHPFGVLTFSQRLLPLEITIDKFGNKVPKDARRFEIKPSDSGLLTEPASEQFAPANFLNLKDSDKLSRSSFQLMKSGFKLTGTSTLVIPATVNKSVDYELTYLRKQRDLRVFAGVYKFMKELFRSNLKAGAIGKSNLAYSNKRVSTNAPEQVQIKGEGFAIASTSDMKQHQGSTVAGSYTEAADAMNQLLKQDPSLRGKVQIVSEHELAA